MATSSSSGSAPNSTSSSVQSLESLSQTFGEYVKSNTNCSVPGDFLVLAIKAMEHLKATGRCNVIYKLAKGLGTMRPDGSDSLFPATRMPMGLIEYNVNFFTSSAINQVRRLQQFLYV